jgi:hypothetical protein
MHLATFDCSARGQGVTDIGNAKKEAAVQADHVKKSWLQKFNVEMQGWVRHGKEGDQASSAELRKLTHLLNKNNASVRSYIWKPFLARKEKELFGG